MSSPLRFTLFFLPIGFAWTYLEIDLVKAALKPAKCAPPSLCGILFVKHKTFS